MDERVETLILDLVGLDHGSLSSNVDSAERALRREFDRVATGMQTVSDNLAHQAQIAGLRAVPDQWSSQVPRPRVRPDAPASWWPCTRYIQALEEYGSDVEHWLSGFLEISPPERVADLTELAQQAVRVRSQTHALATQSSSSSTGFCLCGLRRWRTSQSWTQSNRGANTLETLKNVGGLVLRRVSCSYFWWSGLAWRRVKVPNWCSDRHFAAEGHGVRFDITDEEFSEWLASAEPRVVEAVYQVPLRVTSDEQDAAANEGGEEEWSDWLASADPHLAESLYPNNHGGG